MAETGAKTPVKSETAPSHMPARPRDFFGSLRHEVERVFEDFDRSLWSAPDRWRAPDLNLFHRPHFSFTWNPSVDIAEKDGAFEVTADLPGIDERNVEVKLSNGMLTIKGVREDKKEEKNKDYYLAERQFGSFERSFQVPDSVDSEKIDARFKNGVLTIMLSKKPEALKAEKKIGIKSS